MDFYKTKTQLNETFLKKIIEKPLGSKLLSVCLSSWVNIIVGDINIANILKAYNKCCSFFSGESGYKPIETEIRKIIGVSTFKEDCNTSLRTYYKAFSQKSVDDVDSFTSMVFSTIFVYYQKAFKGYSISDFIDNSAASLNVDSDDIVNGLKISIEYNIKYSFINILTNLDDQIENTDFSEISNRIIALASIESKTDRMNAIAEILNEALEQIAVNVSNNQDCSNLNISDLISTVCKLIELYEILIVDKENIETSVLLKMSVIYNLSYGFVNFSYIKTLAYNMTYLDLIENYKGNLPLMANVDQKESLMKAIMPSYIDIDQSGQTATTMWDDYVKSIRNNELINNSINLLNESIKNLPNFVELTLSKNISSIKTCICNIMDKGMDEEIQILNNVFSKKSFLTLICDKEGERKFYETINKHWNLEISTANKKYSLLDSYIKTEASIRLIEEKINNLTSQIKCLNERIEIFRESIGVPFNQIIEYQKNKLCGGEFLEVEKLKSIWHSDKFNLLKAQLDFCNKIELLKDPKERISRNSYEDAKNEICAKYKGKRLNLIKNGALGNEFLVKVHRYSRLKKLGQLQEEIQAQINKITESSKSVSYEENTSYDANDLDSVFGGDARIGNNISTVINVPEDKSEQLWKDIISNLENEFLKYYMFCAVARINITGDFLLNKKIYGLFEVGDIENTMLKSKGIIVSAGKDLTRAQKKVLINMKVALVENLFQSDIFSYEILVQQKIMPILKYVFLYRCEKDNDDEK